jgi:hypothetical protein
MKTCWIRRLIEKIKMVMAAYVLEAIETEEKRSRLQKEIIQRTKEIGFPFTSRGILISNMHSLEGKIKHESPEFLEYFLQGMEEKKS